MKTQIALIVPKSDLWSLMPKGRLGALIACGFVPGKLIGHTFSLGGGQTIAFRAMGRECRVLGSSLSMQGYCS